MEPGNPERVTYRDGRVRRALGRVRTHSTQHTARCTRRLLSGRKRKLHGGCEVKQQQRRTFSSFPSNFVLSRLFQEGRGSKIPRTLVPVSSRRPFSLPFQRQTVIHTRTRRRSVRFCFNIIACMRVPCTQKRNRRYSESRSWAPAHNMYCD